MRLPPAMQQALDALLQVRPGESQPTLAALQQYPPEATPTAIKAYLDRYHRVRERGGDQIDLRDIRAGVIAHLARLTRRYDVHTVRRLPATRRHTSLLCVLVEGHTTLLDSLVAMHDQRLTTKGREARHVHAERLRALRQRVRPRVATRIATGQSLLPPARPPEPALAEVCRDTIDAQALPQAILDGQTSQPLEERGDVDARHARYPHLRRYRPAFYTRPFAGEPGTTSLRTGRQLVAALDAGPRATLQSQSDDLLWAT